jgi:hypothetical protein
MSTENWITFAVIVGACLIPLVGVAVLDWRAKREQAVRLRQINAQIYEDWETAERRARLAHLNVPAKKGFSAHRSFRGVAGVLHGKEQRR